MRTRALHLANAQLLRGKKQAHLDSPRRLVAALLAGLWWLALTWTCTYMHMHVYMHMHMCMYIDIYMSRASRLRTSPDEMLGISLARLCEIRPAPSVMQ